MSFDNTTTDEPVTPAPVFAFRALRGALFGSPETPCDRDNNKENAPLVNSEFHKKSFPTKKSGSPNNKPTSPKKTHSTEEARSISAPVEMTRKLIRSPKGKGKQGGAVPLGPTFHPGQVTSILASPTRSILRVPGQATPRAQSLRDINVTFKSLSPDESSAVCEVNSVRQWPPSALSAATGTANDGQLATNVTAFNDIPAATATVTPAQAPFPSKVTNNRQPAANVLTLDETTAATDSANFISAEAFKAYQKQTEKEMRRLIIYAQKMRDYAYQADVKNQELSSIIARLQKEKEDRRNEKAALTESVEKTADTLRGPEARSVYGVSAGAMHPHHAPAAAHVQDNPHFNPAVAAIVERNRRRDRAPLSAPPLPAGTKPDSALARYYAGMDDFLSLDPSRGGLPPFASGQQIVDAWMAREKDVDLEALLVEGEAIANAPEDSEFKKRITHPKVYKASGLRAAEAARNAGLPADRSAAARERLAKKSEARKASREV